MKVVGYSDTLSVAPGEVIKFMVSAESSAVTASLVRLFRGDESPRGPGYRETEVPSELDGSYPTTYQPLLKGSYIRIDDAVDLARYPALSVHLICYPTLFGGRDRTLLSASTTKEGRWSLLLDSDGRVVLDYEDPRRPDAGQRISTRRGLVMRHWYSVAVQFDLARRETFLQVEHLALIGAESDSLLLRKECVAEARSPACFAETTFVIGGEDRGLGDVTKTFDGKIAAPALFGAILARDQISRLNTNGDLSGIRNVVASWDFGREIASRTVVDTGPYGLRGRTVNMPTRGVPGPWWEGTSVDYREAPIQYSAIHFHEDDLDDAGWLPTAELKVPNGMPSGVYAARIRDKDGNEDRIPFFVRPPRASASAEVLLLIPAMTYLAYANNHVFEDQSIREFFRNFGREFEFPKQEQDRYIVEQQLHSLYDRHHDGSGVCYSSWLRPLMNMRPTYRKPTLADGEGLTSPTWRRSSHCRLADRQRFQA